MDNHAAIGELMSLAQLDIDAIHAYGQALQHVETTAVRENLEKFMEDHERHVVVLSQKIRDLGGEPPAFTRDFKGFLIEGMTSLMSMTGEKMALEAMKMNEMLTNRMYRQATEKDLPASVRDVVDMGYADEKRHLKYIEDVLG